MGSEMCIRDRNYTQLLLYSCIYKITIYTCGPILLTISNAIIHCILYTGKVWSLYFLGTHYALVVIPRNDSTFSFASVSTARKHEIFQSCFFLANTSILQKWALGTVGVYKHDKIADLVEIT